MNSSAIRRRSVLASAVATGAWGRAAHGATAAAAADEAIHGVWLAGPAHNGFWLSREAMQAYMDALARSGVNTVYVCALSHSRTHFRSAVMRELLGVDLLDELATAFPRSDPLADAIEAGRAAGIRVAAWLEFGFASHHEASKPSPRILDVRPQWAARRIDGQAVVKNGFHWLDALNPQVQTWMLRLCVELAKSHPDLYAIQGDDRLPALPVEGGYSAAALRRFGEAAKRSASAPAPPMDNKDWVQWRADELTHWLADWRNALRAARNGLRLSLAPSPWPWGRDEYLQDWPSWVSRGLGDELIVQLYRRDAQAYERLLLATLAQFKAAQAASLGHAGGSPSVPTQFGAGMLRSLGRELVVKPDVQAQMLAANTRAGVSHRVWFHSAGTAGL